MLDRPPRRMDHRDFQLQVTRTLFALVLVADRHTRFAPGVASHFDTHFPGLFTFGVLDRSRIPASGWWTQSFQTSVGPLRQRGEKADPGYYLLEQGYVVGHVPVRGRPSDPSMTPTITSHLGRLAQARKPADDPWAEAATQPEPVIVPDPETDPFEVLGITASASESQVRAAYRAAMKENHPDRVAHMSAAIQEFAKTQTIAIQEAYEAIQRLRG